MSDYFEGIAPIQYEGPDTNNPLAYRWYQPDRIVLGKPMKDHLRMAVCYWHNFSWNGFDPFGYDGTLQRPWQKLGATDPMAGARAKADAAFSFMSKLGLPYYTFHDRDVAPEGATPRESVENLKAMVEVLGKKQADAGIKLLWGTANAFSHRRFMSGAATNPDPEVFALAALQVREAMNATKALGGINYVLWGGREGYETLLNTDLKHEGQQFGRFLQMVVEHKHKIGLPGFVLIEPKPREPSKHQYDFDVGTVFGMLQQWGLDKEVKVNIEANHATLAGHSFEHEIALANALGIFGSIDANRGDMQCGWDTDQFPNNVPETTLAMFYILQGGGFTHGGFNFDAKARRQSLDPVDMFHAHIGGADVCARALLNAEKLINDGGMSQFVAERYAGWQQPWAQQVLAGKSSLAAVADHALARNIDQPPVSGRQEYLENLVNRYC
jgi:xylose isomerase